MGRILHFVENYLQITETFIYNYILKSAEGGEVAVVTFNLINKEHFPLPDGIRIYEIDPDPSFSRKDLLKFHWVLLRRFTGNRIWYSQMIEIVKSFNPDVVHCHFGVTGVYFMDYLEHRKSTTPFITNFYGYDASELPKRDKVYASGLRKLWIKSEWILAEGPAMSKRLEGLGAPGNKIRISPIIIDGKKYPVKELKDYSKIESVTFLLIGRFVEKKGFHIFLEAIGKIKDEIPEFKIIFIGSGPMQGLYQSTIETYSMQSLVSFLAMKKLSECIEYLVECDVLVQPSVTAANGDTEGGAPTILIEAQIIGIPVIASTHADIPFVMGYNDFLAEEGNTEELSKVIRAFFNSNSISEKITAGRIKVKEQHDMRFTNTYIDILAEFSQ